MEVVPTALTHDIGKSEREMSGEKLWQSRPWMPIVYKGITFIIIFIVIILIFLKVKYVVGWLWVVWGLVFFSDKKSAFRYG